MSEELPEILYTNTLEVPEPVTSTDTAYQVWHNFANTCGETIVPLFTTGKFRVIVSVVSTEGEIE